MRIVIALTLADAGWTRPECRTGDCTWTGHAWRSRWLADRERADHRADHIWAAS